MITAPEAERQDIITLNHEVETANDQLYSDILAEQLSEQQKQKVSALASIAAGITAGMAGGSVGDAITAVQNAVENNALGDGWNNILPSGAIDHSQSQSYAQYAQDKNLPPEQADLTRMVKSGLPESADIIEIILSNNPGSDFY